MDQISALAIAISVSLMVSTLVTVVMLESLRVVLRQSRRLASHFRYLVIHDTHLRYTSVVRTTSLGKCVSTG